MHMNDCPLQPTIPIIELPWSERFWLKNAQTQKHNPSNIKWSWLPLLPLSASSLFVPFSTVVAFKYIQLPPATDCPASAHHVIPTTLLIRLSLTEWQVHGEYTAYYNTHVPWLHVLLYTLLPQPIATTFIAAVATSKAFTSLSRTASYTLQQPFCMNSR